MWWRRDPSGLIQYVDDRETAWKPWDPQVTQLSPPEEWAQGQPVAHPSTPPKYGGGYPQQPVYVEQSTTNGMAIAGIVLGWIGVWILVVIIVLVIAVSPSSG